MAAGDGLISMKPTSIAHAGTSASINADGGVDFSAVTSLSLNGVFTSDYDNYLVCYGPVSAASGYPGVRLRLRLSGSDASGTNYTSQELYASSTTVSGARNSSLNEARVLAADAANRNGAHLHMYGPALAQPTAMRSVQVIGYLGADLYDLATTHSLSTAYDGFTIYPTSSSISGNVHVFGYEE